MPRKIIAYPQQQQQVKPHDNAAVEQQQQQTETSKSNNSKPVCRSFSDSDKKKTPTRATAKNKSKSIPNLNCAVDEQQQQPQAVTRRNNKLRSNNNNNKRRGVVFQISAPVPVQTSTNKQRTVEEQEQLLRQLLEESNAQKQQQQQKQEEIVTVSSRSRMADRIQRTIRALYEGNNNSADKQNNNKSNGKTATANSSPGFIRRRMSSRKNKQQVQLLQANKELDEIEVIMEEDESELQDSPRMEKRALNKKRSPKPQRHHHQHHNNTPTTQPTTATAAANHQHLNAQHIPLYNQPPTKDVDGSRRFKWRGSVNKIAKKFGHHAQQHGQQGVGGTFGQHLEDCPQSPNNPLIPFVVDLCCRLVEERGLWCKGIYRVPGNTGTCNSLIEDLNNKGVEGIDVENDPRFHEVNVISSLIKNYFRTLPDPLFTNELYKSFIETNRKENSEERVNGLRRLVHMLPGPHYQTLKFLITHLKKVADNSDENKMDVKNLAIVFGPTLVRTTASDNMASMVTDMSDQCKIVESILRNDELFFAGEHEEIPAFVRTFI